MGLFNRKKEKRAAGMVEFEDTLLKAILGKASATKVTALNIPSLNGCINYISNTVSMLPIKLYIEKDGKVEEVLEDDRLRILNDDTGDTLDAVQFWNAMIEDYFLGKGGYAYIRKNRNKYVSLHYVNEESLSTNKNTDPIFKEYDILVQGKPYKPYEFLKILRKTKDGCQGISLIDEVPYLLSVGFNTLKFENQLVEKGGNKKGFLKSETKLDQGVIDQLKSAWRKLYSNNEENIVVLNKGIDFKESSNSSVEMQLNENKETNSAEFCKLLNVPESIIKGTANSTDYINGFKLAVMPVIRAIECALNRDFLLEKEKKTHYWAFDTKEVTKGDIKTRYDAYKTAIDANFLQIDEARYMEDLPDLGLDFIKIGLKDVLYNPKTKEVYTPNTGQTQSLGQKKPNESGEGGDEGE